MVYRQRTKFSRQRASSTHGWGAKKKHRGSGHRGGVGMAGTGKKAQGKKTMIWDNPLYFGKHGFKKKGEVTVYTCINLDQLQLMLPKLVAEKKVTMEGKTFIVDLPSLGYTKLLGSGKVTHSLKIKVPRASEKAAAKVAEQGGAVETESTA
ncbi:MAG: uL15 family ribosomal protein [Nanoarchaeota archaeon]|nr:uL15 family ribosomal protein [Nanoarchaeota archaeon]